MQVAEYYYLMYAFCDSEKQQLQKNNSLFQYY